MTIEKEKFKTKENELSSSLQMLRRQLEQQQANLATMEKKLMEGRQEVIANEIQFQSLSACTGHSNVEQSKAKVMKLVENLKKIK